MTYLVGLRYESTSAILCDSVISSDSERGEVLSDTFLKSGLLAPGIIYAYCGMVVPAQRFVKAAKDFLTGRLISDDFWSPFVAFATHYVANNVNKGQFNLLLSERSTGQPRFHVFDSNEGFTDNIDPPITLGDGRELLDDVVYGMWGAKAHEVLCRENGLPSIHFPYVYALFLMERAQGFEAPKLQDAGVGGYFHFSYQTGDQDSRQSPAVYVLVTVDHARQRLIGWTYRVSFCGPALVVECPVKNQRRIILESSSWPRCADLTKKELEDLHRVTDLEVESQPFYNFCGFGVADPELRGSYCMNFTASDDYLVDRKGNTKPEYETILKRLIADGIGINK